MAVRWLVIPVVASSNQLRQVMGYKFLRISKANLKTHDDQKVLMDSEIKPA